MKVEYHPAVEDEVRKVRDYYEERSPGLGARHTALARASLAHFADAPTPANLNLLFHKSYSIDSTNLRKSILTSACRGKLAPQISEEEPAQRALRRAGVNLQDWAVPENVHRDKIPETWAWLRFGGVGDTTPRENVRLCEKQGPTEAVSP